MDVLKSSYYIRINRYLSFCGHWPYQSFKIRMRNQILMIIALFSLFIPQTVMMFEVRHNLNYFIISVWVAIYGFEWLSKNIFGIVKSKEIKNLFEKIKHDFLVNSNEDLEVLHEYSNTANKFNTFYTVYVITVCILISAVPLTLKLMDDLMPLNQTRLQEKPRLILYNIDTFDNSIYFIIFHGVIIDVLSVIVLIGVDTLYLSVIYHACALFVITSRKMKKAIESQAVDNSNGSQEDFYENNQDQLYRNLCKTANMHSNILEFVDTIESAFSYLYLVSIGCSVLLFAIAGFEALLNKDNPITSARFIFWALGVIMHLFFYNWPGQKITEYSLFICDACYNSEWYRKEFSIKCRKLMIVIMMRSQKQCYVTAGGVYILGLENLAAVLKVSMSYLTVLSAVM